MKEEKQMINFDELFLAHANFITERESLIKKIANGETDIELCNDLSNEDLEYIEDRLFTDYGIEVKLSLK